MTGPKFFQTVYDRGACDVGVVHVGYGAFHRAHQAVYFDDYMQASGDLRWGIAAVNLRASDSASFATAARARDGYLLKSIAPDGTQEFRAVRSHIMHVDAALDMAAALDLFTRRGVHAVSITVTESGYALHKDQTLDLSAPAIAAELAGGPIRTIYGYLTQGLARRRETTGAAMTILCCDNIRGNGRVLDRALQAYLAAAGEALLAAWVRENVTFPCSMVDRITPRSTPALEKEVSLLWPGHGVAPVHGEDFMQWVLEDRFAGAMPDLAQGGVQIVEDVGPYEEAKIRILNGGHTGLAYLGALAKYRTFDAALGDPELRAHFERWEDEVIEGLGPGFPFSLAEYRAQVTRRFSNPGIADQLERICMDGYAKIGLYLRPTLQACWAQGRVPRAGLDAAAAWIVFARKHAAGTAAIPYHEPSWDTLAPLLARGHEMRLAQDPNLWGDLAAQHPGFAPGLAAAIERMETQWPD